MTITVPVIPCVMTLIPTIMFFIATSDEDKTIVTIAGAFVAGLSFLTSYGFCSLTGLL